ncbi:hypothetical protein HPP92_015624 [Vanilla planifolia]|uniref:Uncharacterized protein n=1 Tax=Vanilla planifolia TaxID=51239 RepID=A0A835QM16_VANPL|nr:hypothetical protein HPP92_015624 [Vanilla planifolia]
MEAVVRLPCTSDLSQSLLNFLAEEFKTPEDLSRSSVVESELQKRCSDIESSLSNLRSRLSDRISVTQLTPATATFLLLLIFGDLLAVDGEEDKGSGRTEQILGEELPALAREVARVETVRAYAETALKLDSLVGDVEDAVSSSVHVKLISPSSQAAVSEETRLLPINSLKQIEDIVESIVQARPHWAGLVSAVDHRVDRSLAILRPQAIVDHRSLLSSLGWPPPLAALSLSSQKAERSSGFSNPLLTMKGDLKAKYSESFFSFAICSNCKLEEKPWVDKARLVGYSCREEWISAMVTSLSTYLAKEVFPQYLDHLEDDGMRTSWLQLIDLMISFDKRMQSLLNKSGLLILLEGKNLQSVSVFSVFCDRHDWLEDYKSPAISGMVLQSISLLIERAKSIPSISLRSKFLNSIGSPIIQEFLDCLLRRCQESEGLTALADDDAMINVACSINAARYFESTLMEWCEDLFFIEIETTEKNSMFEAEIKGMKDLEDEWSEKISTVILRGFDARCRDYLRNKKQWQEKGEEARGVLTAFVGALSYLQEKISKIEAELNEIDFVRGVEESGFRRG